MEAMAGPVAVVIPKMEDRIVDKNCRKTRRRWNDAFDQPQDLEYVEGDEDDDDSQVDEQKPHPEKDKAADKSNKESKKIVCQMEYCQKVCSSLKEYESHYDSRHRWACCICKKVLPSCHILELHVLENHDTFFGMMAIRKPMYNCFLESCTNVFQTPKQRKDHCMDAHKFPETFRFWNIPIPAVLNAKPQVKYTSKSKNGGLNPVSGEVNVAPGDNGDESMISSGDNGTVPEETSYLKPRTAADINAARVKKEAKANSLNSISPVTPPPPTSISFGQRRHLCFSKTKASYTPKSTFGLKPKPKESLGNSNTVAMDFSEVQAALDETASVDIEPQPDQ